MQAPSVLLRPQALYFPVQQKPLSMRILEPHINIYCIYFKIFYTNGGKVLI